MKPGASMSPGRRLLRLARRLTVLALLVSALAAIAWLAKPIDERMFDLGHRTVTVTDRHGTALLQLVGGDEQWRTPVKLSEISPWVIHATIAVEDKRFRRHAGVDVAAIGRAAMQNVQAGEVVSGASTLTMQLCRMADPRPRTLRAKLVEAARAAKLERRWSKDRILEAYLNRAPYGGNLRGIAAASGRWLGKAPADLSLAEAALLAGLPQSPQRYRPDVHLSRALGRQRQVLAAMLETGAIDRKQYEDALDQEIRIVSRRRGQVDLQAGFMALSRRPGGGRTTLDLKLMGPIEALVRRHIEALPAGTCCSVAVIEISGGQLRAVVNVGPDDGPGSEVNLARAPRSPGSALKPFIYAAAIDAGRLAPDSTLWDVPIRAGGWEPGNFDGAFLGEMTATDALRQSRNVPAIHVARATGLGRCVGVLASAGVDLGSQAQRRGGLAIVTGAVEVSLLELTNAYATLGSEGVYRPWRLFADAPSPMRRALTTEAAEAVNLMLAQGGQGADLHPNYMAKTGTSSGRRDAWTLGHNGRFAVGVWIGRLAGSGRQAFVGGRCSGPLLDQIMHLDGLAGDFRVGRDLQIAVSRPIKRPSSEPALRIVSPADGQTLQSIAGSSVVHLSATGGEDLQWFLNDNRLAPGAGRVELPPGRHELRCVSAAGRIDRSRVVVLP